MAAIRGFSLNKLTKINIAFSVFDSKAASARELFRIVSAGRMKMSNSKCQVRCSIVGNFADPSVEVEFSDGSTMKFESNKCKALEMVAKINTKAKTL